MKNRTAKRDCEPRSAPDLLTELGWPGQDDCEGSMNRNHWIIFVAGVALGASQVECSSKFSSCEARRNCPAAGGPGTDGGSSGEVGNDTGEGGGAATDDAGEGGSAGADDATGSNDARGGVGGEAEEAEEGSAGATSECGDGKIGRDEQCDQGAGNGAKAYGRGLCTDQCQRAPYCGDGVRNGP